MGFLGWGTKRAEVEALSKKIDQLTQIVAAGHQSHGLSAPEILASVIDGQSKQVESTSAFIRMIHEISLERMASAMGKRGGRKRASTAQRDAKGRMLPARKAAPAGDCVLCDDPNAADFTLAEFEEHMKHKGRRPSRERRESREDAQEESVDVTPSKPREYPIYPLPVVQRPGADDGSGIHSEAGSQANGDGSEEAHLH